MLAIRKQFPVFGLGDYVMVESDNDAILSFTRTVHDDDDPDDEIETRSVLCVNNLSSRPQSVTVSLPSHFAGVRVRDLFGGAHFPPVGDDGTVTLTLGSRDFFWLALQLPTGN